MRAQSALTGMFQDAGFRLIRTGNHPIWGCPCGHTKVTGCSSIGKGRAFTNARLQIQRALRGCEKGVPG